MLWRPKTNCEISPLLQSIKKYPACKSSCNSVMCNDLHLFLSSIVFCGSSVRHEPWPHSTNLHPASLFYGHFWIQKWSLRSTRYRYMIWLLLGGTFWLLWQGKNARFALHPLFTSGTKRNSTSLSNKRSFYFVDYILRCSRTAKKRFIRYLATAYYLDGIWHVSKPGTLKISLKGNKNRKPTDSKLINPSIASTGHQEGSTQKPFSEHLKRVKWMAPKKWRSRIQELGEIHSAQHLPSTCEWQSWHADATYNGK